MVAERHSSWDNPPGRLVEDTGERALVMQYFNLDPRSTPNLLCDLSQAI